MTLLDRKTGTYYWRYLVKTKGSKLGKPHYSKNFEKVSEAVAYAKSQKNKWLQAELWFTESLISDVLAQISLNTKGNVMKFDPKQNQWVRL
jgi:hypothetical protein